MSLTQDIRYAWRILFKSPLATLVAVLSLSLGIASNGTIFSLIHAYLLTPFPYSEPERLVHLFESQRSQGDALAPVSPANYFDWQERSRQLDQLAALKQAVFNVTGDGPPEQVSGQNVTANLFAVLGAEALIGRVFGAGDDDPGAERTAVLSHAFWSRRYGGDHSIIGQDIALDGERHVVLGVMPEDFVFLGDGLWVPLQLQDLRQERGDRFLIPMGRLKPGATFEGLEEEMKAIAANLEKEHPETNDGYGARVLSLREFILQGDDSVIWILMAGVGFVLLIACANVANLLLARGERRRREIAVRAALGAGKRRLVRQLLTESVVLASLGGVAGVALCFWGINLLTATLPPSSTPMVPRLNFSVIGFLALVSIVSGLIFGMAPAFSASRAELTESLKSEGRGGTAGRKRSRLRGALVVVQVSLALVLLFGAVLLIQAFTFHQEVNPGFETSRLLTLNLSMLRAEEAGSEGIVRFFEEAGWELSELPGVASAAAVSVLPRSSQTSRSGFVVEGQTPPRPGESPTTSWLTSTPGYFRTVGIPLLQGRPFEESDRSDSPPVIIVSQNFAERFLGESPIGERIEILDKSREVVGVASNIFQRRIITRSGSTPLVYLPHAQQPQATMTFVLSTEGDPVQLSEPARQAIWRTAPEQPIGTVKSMEEHIAWELDGPRRLSSLILTLGAVALGLACSGIYAVMAYSVTTRRREIGIRMAMGASAVSVVRMVARQGLTLMLIGIALALPPAFMVWNLLRIFFTGIATADILVPAAATLLLTAVGLAATYIPSRAAARVDPSVALRGEL